MGKYRFNRETLKFVEDKIGLKGWVKRILKYFIVSILLALLYYFVISVVYSTESEREILRENKMLEQELSKMSGKLKILENSVENLRNKDKEIYRDLFDSEPLDLGNSYGDNPFFSQIDTTNNDRIIEFTAERLLLLQKEADAISGNFRTIDSAFAGMGGKQLFIPSIVPIKNFKINQTGASVGNKINPFFKTVVKHTGIDLLANAGTEVIAPANGTVISTSRASKGTGNTVVINHGNGYVTKYMYLGDILVRQGQSVKLGDAIARVGVTGMSFGPHLHYEVIKDGVNMDPVYYFYSSMSPKMAMDLMIRTANTGQSLD